MSNAAGHLLPDGAQSHDAERLAGQLGQGALQPGQRPVALDERGVRGYELFGRRQHQGEGLLGHLLRLGTAGTDGADDHPSGARGVQVDVVEAVARALYELQLRCGGEVFGGHRGERGDDDMRRAQGSRVLADGLYDGDVHPVGQQRREAGARRAATHVGRDDGQDVLRGGMRNPRRGWGRGARVRGGWPTRRVCGPVRGAGRTSASGPCPSGPAPSARSRPVRPPGPATRRRRAGT